MAQVQVRQALPITLQGERALKERPPYSLIPELSDGYRKQFVYILQAYDPVSGGIRDIYLFRTLETLQKILFVLREDSLLPLVCPNPIYVPEEFWRRYRHLAYFDPEEVKKLTVRYGLLRDDAIYLYRLAVIDVDSPYEAVLPAWRELQERLGIHSGYRLFKTKSGRFRAYLQLDGTKDLKRARELLAVIYAFFERKGLKADRSFVDRLNHPVFYEDYPLYRYELMESVEGEIPFFDLYRRVKRLQRRLGLWTFSGSNLTERFWGVKPPPEHRSYGRKRRFRKGQLDVLGLWKKAVASLAERCSSYRYTYVIQPAVGWAKYLELPEGDVTEFLVELLGESKRRDVERGWRYARELEFRLPDWFTRFGKTVEELEREVVSLLQFRRSVSRQELIREVFYNQRWLCDLVMQRLVQSGVVTFKSVIYGRGRPKKVYSLTNVVRVPLRKAVGCEWITQASLRLSPPHHNKQNFVVGLGGDFRLNNNSLSERAMGGGWKGAAVEGVMYESRDTGGGMSKGSGSAPQVELNAFDRALYERLVDRRMVFNLTLAGGRVVKDAWVAKYSLDKHKLVVSGEVFSLPDVFVLEFTGREAVRFYKEVLPTLPPSFKLDRFDGKTIWVYPYGGPPEKWTLVRFYPYNLILHRVKTVRRPDGTVKKLYTYQVRYKLSLSGYAFINPYPEELIRQGTPTGRHEASTWVESSLELLSYLKEEFKERGAKELKVTLALKDGREITGLMKKYVGYKGPRYLLMAPDDPVRKITVFKHAVDDFWLEE